MEDDDLQHWWMTEVERLSDPPVVRAADPQPAKGDGLGNAEPSSSERNVVTGSSLVPVTFPDADRWPAGRGLSARVARAALLGLALGLAFGAGLVLANRVPFDMATDESAADASPMIDSTAGPAPVVPAAPAEGPEPNPTTADGALIIESDPSAAAPTVPESPSPSVPVVPLEVVSSVEPTDDNPAGAVRYAVYRDGTAYLRGLARDGDAVERLESTFGEVFGADNVVSEYEIDEAAPRWTDAPIYFENVVLFDIGSSELRPEFLTLLEQVAQLIDQGPFVSIEVVGRTDASGSTSFNQKLAEDRAWAVVDYYVNELGVPDHRVTPEVIGEQDADPLADPAMAALERRVELRVSGLRG